MKHSWRSGEFYIPVRTLGDARSPGAFSPRPTMFGIPHIDAPRMGRFEWDFRHQNTFRPATLSLLIELLDPPTSGISELRDLLDFFFFFLRVEAEYAHPLPAAFDCWSSGHLAIRECVRELSFFFFIVSVFGDPFRFAERVVTVIEC